MAASANPCEVPGDHGQVGAVLVSARCRQLRRELRPLAWMVLEDVALDAVAEEGRLVARTSARRLAGQLGIDPGTAANALRQLRRRGLLALERDPGPAGRFGLAVYVLGDVEGLAVVAPNSASALMGEPDMVGPCVAEPDMASPDMASPDTADVFEGRAVTNLAGQPRIRPGAPGSARRRKRRPAPAEPPGQVALDLGLGTT